MEASWFNWVQAVAAGILAVIAIVQAVAAGLLVYLTWRTLLVLRGYAEDTRRIADKGVEQVEKSVQQIQISVQQTENARKPFLALVLKEADLARHFGGGWAIENQGSGAALNIRYRHGSDADGGWVNRTPLAKGDFHLLNSYDPAVAEAKGFTIVYESLGEIEYATVVSWSNAVMRTRFATPPPRVR